MSKILILFSVLVILTGCRTKEYVEVPTVKTQYIVRADTVNTKDSVYVWNSDTVLVKGDSVIVTRWRVKETLRDVFKVRVDTLVRRDTISVPVPIERGLGWWERAKTDLFFPVLMAAVVAIAYIVVWIIRKRT